MSKQLDIPSIGAKPPTGLQAGTKKEGSSAGEPSPCFHAFVFDNNIQYMASPSNRRMIWWLCQSTLGCVNCLERLKPKYSPEVSYVKKVQKSSKGP